MKRLLIVVLIVLVVAGGLTLIVPLAMSSAPVKQRIADQLADWTGRRVTFVGDPRIRLFPYLRMQIPNLTIGDPSGAETFIAMDTLSGSLRLVPLLLGRVEVAEFRLSRPRIHLRKTDATSSNWELRQVSRERRRPGPPARLKLNQIKIFNGTVTWDDDAADRHETISAIELKLGWPSAEEPIVGSGEFTWRGETVEFNGSLADPTGLNEGKLSPARIAIASTPIRASFTGNVSRLAGVQFDGPVNLSTPSLRRLVNWLGAPTEPGSTLGAAAIEGKLNWNQSSIAVTEAKLELDGNVAEGTVSANLDGPRPAIQGTLALGQLDLSPYLEAFRAELNAAPGTAEPIRMPLLAAVDLDLRVSTEQVLLGSARIGNVAAAASVKDGRLAVEIGGAQLYSGSLAAKFSAEMRGDRFVGDIEAKMSAVPAGLALSEFAGVTALDGTGDATLAVEGSGRSWNEVAHTLSGTVKLGLVGGSLAGLDMARIAAILDERAASAPAASGSTGFSSGAATLTIADGAITTSDLSAEGTDFRVDLSAQASLFSPAVSGLGTLTIRSATAGDTGTALPFELGGTWREPEIFPDLGRILKRSSIESDEDRQSHALAAHAPAN
ncbi:MAG: AsmA family protein [Bauldia sp.]